MQLLKPSKRVQTRGQSHHQELPHTASLQEVQATIEMLRAGCEVTEQRAVSENTVSEWRCFKMSEHLQYLRE